MCASVVDPESMTVLSKAENRGVRQSERSLLSGMVASVLWAHFYALRNYPTFSPIPLSTTKMPDRASSPSTSSSDDEEYSTLPGSKREYLLAQLKQKDGIIESLLKQVGLTRPTNIQATADGSCLVTQPVSCYASLDRGVPDGNIFG